MYRLLRAIRLNKRTFLGILVIFLFTSTVTVSGQTQEKELTTDCKDLMLVFLRGSGQNKESRYVDTPFDARFNDYEKESYQFFVEQRGIIEKKYPNVTFKAISIHDFPGKYDPVGYQAAGIFPEVLNAANAEFSFIPGEYRPSVDHGVNETAGYLKDQIAICPDQGIIAGGYSQGAQVLGDALFKLTAKERENILGVSLFGDPKYIGVGTRSDLSKGSQPWRRGTAIDTDRGMLESRIPYVPVDIEKRVTSWCGHYDIICAGLSSLRPDFRAVHESYSLNSMNYSAVEMMQLAASHLAKAEKARGGILTDSSEIVFSSEDYQKKRDVMFLFNDNSNSSTISTFRYNLNLVLYDLTRKFTDLNFAAKSFKEHDYGFSTPGVDTIQSFLPYKTSDPSDPRSKDSNLGYAFAAKYPFGQPQLGGGDNKDPYQIAIERAVVSSGWRQDAEKNIILIVDRPPKDPYQYNICNSTIRQWLHYPEIDGYKNCYTNFKAETWQKVLIPEACANVFLVITEDTCTNPLKAPNITQNNIRTLEDNVKLAQSYGVKISIVIPHYISPQQNNYNQLSLPEVRDKLKNIAYATGGTFVYYDQRTKYDAALLDDTLNQVFAKPTRSLSLSTTTAEETNNQVAPRHLKTNHNVIFDVSQSNVIADSYRWDFDDDGTWDQTTPGPLTDFTYANPQTGFARIQALSDNQVVAEARQAVIVNTEPNPTLATTPPVIPATLAQQTASGGVTLTWQSNQEGKLFVVDPVSKLPLGGADLATGALQIPAPADYQALQIIVANGQAASQSTSIEVAQYVAPAQAEVPQLSAQTTNANASPAEQPATTAQRNNRFEAAVSDQDSSPSASPQVAAATSQTSFPAATTDTAEAATKSTTATKTPLLLAIAAILFITTTIVVTRKILNSGNRSHN